MEHEPRLGTERFAFRHDLEDHVFQRLRPKLIVCSSAGSPVLPELHRNRDVFVHKMLQSGVIRPQIDGVEAPGGGNQLRSRFFTAAPQIRHHIGLVYLHLLNLAPQILLLLRCFLGGLLRLFDRLCFCKAALFRLRRQDPWPIGRHGFVASLHEIPITTAARKRCQRVERADACVALLSGHAGHVFLGKGGVLLQIFATDHAAKGVLREAVPARLPSFHDRCHHPLGRTSLFLRFKAHRRLRCPFLR